MQLQSCVRQSARGKISKSAPARLDHSGSRHDAISSENGNGWRRPLAGEVVPAQIASDGLEVPLSFDGTGIGNSAFVLRGCQADFSALLRRSFDARNVRWLNPPRRASASISDVARITELLREARARTVRLIEPLSDEDLRIQHDPLMSPIVWDLGHIAHFEELWLNRNVHGTVEFGEMPGIYNPFEHPRRARGALDLPGRDEVLEILAEVRERVLRKLETLDLEAGDPLLRDGYVYAMVAQHEYQHNETILQTLQLKRGEPYRAPREIAGSRAATSTSRLGRWCDSPAARSRSARTIAARRTITSVRATSSQLRPFRIDVSPVTNGQYLEFIEDGGYSRRELWTDAGWAWKEADAGDRAEVLVA